MKKVFTNGCFDLFHPGHLYLLDEASKLGSLTVAVDSDKSVKNFKGSDRPIISSYNRAYMVERCKGVFNVIRDFESKDLGKILENFDVYVKGGDYTEEQLRKELPNFKGEIVIIPSFFKDEYSTTKIIERIRNGK
jgi:rfaE bifunctional protein nucleotidyltransferase chain/domain